MPPILQAYSSMDPADMILRKAHWVTVGLWHRVQHWPWNRHSWRRYVHVSTKKQVKKQTNRKKERKENKQQLTFKRESLNPQCSSKQIYIGRSQWIETEICGRRVGHSLLRSHFDIKPISCSQGMRKAYDERNILKFEFAT